MRRRDLLPLLLGLIGGSPTSLLAQQKQKPVVGWLGLASGALFQAAVPGFREGLAGQGYIEGENVAIVYRFAEEDSAKLPALAAELVTMPVDVIVASGGPPANEAALVCCL